VVDYLATRPDVDMSKLALAGISFGGTLAPIAASHDHRYSAVIALDGLVSLQDAVIAQAPPLETFYNSTNATIFDEYMNTIRRNTSYPSSIRWLIDQGLFSFNTESPYDWWGQVGNITMSPEIVANLSMPVFVGKGEDDTDTVCLDTFGRLAQQRSH
jgi:hypothetical protein